jgi:hypothetical protein
MCVPTQPFRHLERSREISPLAMLGRNDVFLIDLGTFFC